LALARCEATSSRAVIHRFFVPSSVGCIGVKHFRGLKLRALRYRSGGGALQSARFVRSVCGTCCRLVALGVKRRVDASEPPVAKYWQMSADGSICRLLFASIHFIISVIDMLFERATKHEGLRHYTENISFHFISQRSGDDALPQRPVLAQRECGRSERPSEPAG